MFASFWIKFTYLCLQQVYMSFPLIYSRHLTSLGFCYCKKQIGISFLCVCPLIDDGFHHNIVKVYCKTTRLRLVVPQPLWRCYDAIRRQCEDGRIKDWLQFVKLKSSGKHVPADGVVHAQNKCEIRKCFTYRGDDRKNVTGTVKVFKNDQ